MIGFFFFGEGRGFCLVSKIWKWKMDLGREWRGMRIGGSIGAGDEADEGIKVSQRRAIRTS